MGVHVEHDRVAGDPAGLVRRERVAVVAVRLEVGPELPPLVRGLRDGEVARDGPQPGAVDADGPAAHLRVRAVGLDEVGLDRHKVEAGELVRPEDVEVRRLGRGIKPVGLHAGAAVEEDVMRLLLEFVHRLLPLGRRGVAGELLRVALAVGPEDVGLQPDEARPVEARAVDEGRGGERDASGLAGAEVVGARPLERVFALGQLALDAHGLDGEDDLLAGGVGERVLVGRALEPGVVERAGEGGGGKDRGGKRECGDACAHGAQSTRPPPSPASRATAFDR